MPKQKIDPRATFRGYTAHRQTQTDYTDRYGSNGSLPVYKLTLDTPFDPGDKDDYIDKRLKCDLGGIFPEIGLISHTETTKRVFSDDLYIPLGCRKVIEFSKGLVQLELLLYDPFEGFPVAGAAAQDNADPDPEIEDPDPEEDYDEQDSENGDPEPDEDDDPLEF